MSNHDNGKPLAAEARERISLRRETLKKLTVRTNVRTGMMNNGDAEGGGGGGGGCGGCSATKPITR